MLSTQAFAGLCRARDMLCEVHDRPLSIDEVARDIEFPGAFRRQ